MNIGFVGLGEMGMPMARNLAAGGDTLWLYDTDLDRLSFVAEHIPDGYPSESLAELAATCKVIFTMLPDGVVVRDVALGKHGLIHTMQAGSVLVDSSSSEPWLTIEIAKKLEEKDIAMVDAPVSGGVGGAEAGRLTFMCGGSSASITFVTPILERMGARVLTVGNIGSGHVMKSINNLITSITLLGTIEALLIGKSYGLDSKTMLEVINSSSGASSVSQRKIEREILSRAFDGRFRLELMRKDVGIATELASRLNVPVPLCVQDYDLWRQAETALPAGVSTPEIARWCEENAGVKL